MSQRQLAERLGCSQNYVWKRLAGQKAFDVDDIDAIAQAFEMSPFDLIKPRGEQGA